MKKLTLIVLLIAGYIASIYFLFFYTKSSPVPLRNKGLTPLTRVHSKPDNQAANPKTDTNVVQTGPKPGGWSTYPPLSAHQEDSMRSDGKTVSVNQGNITAYLTTDSIRKGLKKGFVILNSGGVTKTSYKWYKKSYALKELDITESLIAHRIPKATAERLSPGIINALKSKTFSRVTVFATATGFSLTVEEFLFPHLTFWQRLLIAASFGLLIVLIFVIAQNKGLLE